MNLQTLKENIAALEQEHGTDRMLVLAAAPDGTLYELSGMEVAVYRDIDYTARVLYLDLAPKEN